MKKFCFILIFLPFLFFSCGGGGGGGVLKAVGNVFFNDTQPNDRISSNIERIATPSTCPTSSKVYTFLLIADTHFGVKNYGTLPFSQIEQTVKNRTNIEDKPTFIAVIGDITDSGTESEYLEYVSFINKVSSICGGAKVLNAVGNHDLRSKGWENWKKYAFPGNSFYSFSVPNWNRTFYFIDTASGTMGKKQLQNFSNAVKQDGNRKFIFSHYPFYGDTTASNNSFYVLPDTAERNTLFSLCANYNVDAVFCGHFHEPYYTTAPKAFIQVASGSMKKDKKGFRHWTFVKVNEIEKKAYFTRYDLNGDASSPVATNWEWSFK